MYVCFQIKHNVEGKNDQTWLAINLVIGTLLDEPISGEYPKNTPMRMLLTPWLTCVFILGTVYRSNLTACLTIPTYPPRPETLVDLLNIGARYILLHQPPCKRKNTAETVHMYVDNRFDLSLKRRHGNLRC